MFSIDDACTADNVYGLPDDVTFDEVWAVCVEKGWEYGAEFIPEDEFTGYIKDLISDAYADVTPKSDDWPYRHMTMDYDAAADEAKSDYDEVELAGVTYLVREI